MNAELIKRYDLIRFRKLLAYKDDTVKDYFNKEGCGLEIEVGVRYERRCRDYIENGLKKMKAAVGGDGKFVEDNSIGEDMDIEIVLNPLDKEALKEKFRSLKAIINHYENFVFTPNCGVHATFLVYEEQKKYIYDALAAGGYKSAMFVHSKYKPDMSRIIIKDDGTKMSYDEYMKYQNEVSYKYVAVNFLKKNLVEFRSLDMDWKKIEYVIDFVDKTLKKLE